LSLVVALSVLSPATAQESSRNSKRIVELFAPVIEKPVKSVVRVRCKDQSVALGTIVSADGWIITKASELSGDKIVVRLHDDTELEAELVRKDDKYDLAALKVDAKDLTAVTWSDSKVAPVGRWVASAGTGKLPVAIGVIGVSARELKGPPPNPNAGFLGVGFDLEFSGVKITEITANSPAQKAGLKSGDLVRSVNGKKVGDADDFIAIVQSHKVGDELTLKIERDKKEQELKVTLGKRPGNRGRIDQNSMGSTLSNRRTGFPVVLQHDCVVKPSDCGGPLVDLKGRVVGINIARAGRTETYAIPGEVVVKLLPALKGDRTKKEQK
jgi:serine protease Do